MPARLQRTAVSGCPLLMTFAWNACVAPSSTLAGFGASDSVISLVMVTLAEADLVASAWLVAVICTVAVAGRSAGAVYTPAVVIVPAAEFPPAMLPTLQLTLVSAVFVTAAVKVNWFPSTTEPLAGATVTTKGGGGGGATAPPPPQPSVHAPTARRAMRPSLLRLFPLLRGRGRMPSAKQANGQRKELDQEDGLENRLVQ